MKKAIIHQHYPLDYAGEEALNSICTNLAFIGTDKRKIVITSNSQSEGKSWMTMHIAENMARRGRHVVLVDADMRRSFMVQRYKLELEGEGLGLAHFLAGQHKRLYGIGKVVEVEHPHILHFTDAAEIIIVCYKIGAQLPGQLYKAGIDILL